MVKTGSWEWEEGKQAVVWGQIGLKVVRPQHIQKVEQALKECQFNLIYLLFKNKNDMLLKILFIYF